MTKKTFDPELLMTRYLELRDTTNEAPQYWDAVNSFNQFTEDFVVVSGRAVAFDDNYTDAEIDKMLSNIEKSFAKELRHLRSTAASSLRTGVAQNTYIAKD